MRKIVTFLVIYTLLAIMCSIIGTLNYIDGNISAGVMGSIGVVCWSICIGLKIDELINYED